MILTVKEIDALEFSTDVSPRLIKRPRTNYWLTKVRDFGHCDSNCIVRGMISGGAGVVPVEFRLVGIHVEAPRRWYSRQGRSAGNVNFLIGGII